MRLLIFDMCAEFLEVNNASVVLSGGSDRKHFRFIYNFSCGKGDIIGVYGPSGGGKTTFFRTITGLIRSEKGSKIILDGSDITHAPTRKRNIGLVFQDYAVFDTLSVEWNLKFALLARHIKHREWKEKVDKSLDFVRLLHVRHQKAGTLSGGEKQRLAIVRSCIVPPKVLLLDEPLNSIDPELKSYIIGRLMILNRENNLTMIIISHNSDELREISAKTVSISTICRKEKLN